MAIALSFDIKDWQGLIEEWPGGEPDDAEQLAQEQAAYRANFARARHAGHCVTPVIDTNTGDVAGQWCRECGTTI